MQAYCATELLDSLKGLAYQDAQMEPCAKDRHAGLLFSCVVHMCLMVQWYEAIAFPGVQQSSEERVVSDRRELRA